MKNIKQYLNNQLPENHMNQITRTLLKEAFEEDHKAHLGNILEEKFKVVPPQKKRTNRIRLYSIISIAASILLLFIASQVYQDAIQPSADKLVADYLSKPLPHNFGRKGITEEHIRANGNEAYQTENYKDAIINYTQLMDDEKGDIVDQFYLGLSYLYNNQVEQAIQALSAAKSMELSNTFQDKEDINWFLSLAYLKNGQKDAAKKELNFIITNNLYRSVDAAKLLSTLE